MDINQFQERADKIVFNAMNRSLPMMTKMFECSANCTRNATSQEAANPCLEQCQKPVEELQRFIERKVQQVEQNLMNCQQPCMKLVKGQDVSEAMECAKKCFTETYPQLDKLEDSIFKFQDSLL